MTEVAVIDYGICNISSVLSALNKLNIRSNIYEKMPAKMKERKILLPGVASFGAGIDELKSRNFYVGLQDQFALGKKIVGFCLGAQMMLTFSDESPGIFGLDLIKGKSKNLINCKTFQGWSKISTVIPFRYEKELNSNFFYFSHSFSMHLDYQEKYENSLTFNQEGVLATFEIGNLLGVQFHPELSGKAGLEFLNQLFNNNL